MAPHGVSPKSFNAVPYNTGQALLWELTAEGKGRYPSVKITSPWYLAMRTAGRHQHGAFVRFFAKRVRRFGVKAKHRKQSAQARKITGCNWFYFLNGFFADDDVLGRHPNETEVANGAPYGETLWPDPLGY